MTKYMVVHAAVNVFDADYPKEEATRRHLTRRLRKGQTVDSDAELKHAEIDRLLELGAIREAGALEPDDEVEQVEEAPDYDAMSYPDLQKLAKARELSAGGSAAEIVERLKDQDAERAEDTAAQQRLAEMSGGGGDQGTTPPAFLPPGYVQEQ